MPLHIVRNDITVMEVDVVVNAANHTLLGGGGVDGCIHRAAGPQLQEYCRGLGGCQTGQAKITPGFDMPCRHIIHTVGPVWQGGDKGERELLASCYAQSIRLAIENGAQSIAFPLISSGAYGYPHAEALHVATDTIRRFLMRYDLTVYLVVFDRRSFDVTSRLYADVAQYVDEHYVRASLNHWAGRQVTMPPELEGDRTFERVRGTWDAQAEYGGEYEAACAPMDFGDEWMATPCGGAEYGVVCASMPASLEQAVSELDESFSQMLLRKIDERGMTDAQCYRKANIDRKLFSKIRSQPMYKPSKPTVLAFAVALELSLAETEEMLKKAGFALSHSSKFDVIVEYFIRNGLYDIFTINEALFAYDQLTLG